MDMVVVDKLVEEVNKKLFEEYNDLFKFSRWGSRPQQAPHCFKVSRNVNFQVLRRQTRYRAKS